MRRRALGSLDSERRQAARTALPGEVVTRLDRLGQREERPDCRQRPFDQRRVDAMIGDNGKAGALERCPESPRRRGGVLLDQRQRDRRYTGRENPARGW